MVANSTVPSSKSSSPTSQSALVLVLLVHHPAMAATELVHTPVHSLVPVLGRVLLQTDTAGRTLIAAEALGAEVEVEVEGTFIVVEDVVDLGHPFAEDLEEDLQATLVVDMDDVGQGRGATRFVPVALVLVLGRFLVRAPVPEQDPARGQCRILPTRDTAEAEAEAEAARDHSVEEGGVSVVKIFGIVGPVPGHLETSVIIRSFCCIRMNF